MVIERAPIVLCHCHEELEQALGRKRAGESVTIVLTAAYQREREQQKNEKKLRATHERPKAIY